jgi:sugar/nucleoside kinase (ribokinase family)
VAEVICAGVHVLDVLAGPLPSGVAPWTPRLVDRIRLTVAGTAGGVAVDLARLGVDVAAVGMLGADEAGDFIVRVATAEGVETSRLRRTTAHQTSMSMLLIDSRGERIPVHVVGTNALVEPEQIVADADTKVFHLGGLDVMPRLWESASTLLSRARDTGAVTTLDLLGSAVRRHAIDWDAVLPEADWFVPNEHQLTDLSGTTDRHAAVEWALARGAKRVALTLGGDGCLLALPGQPPQTIPARTVDVVDTTGCGDAFAAGLITAIVRGHDDRTAVEWGLVAGALNARDLGSDAGAASLDELHNAIINPE